jgi:large subunit ribosomal protein L10
LNRDQKAAAIEEIAAQIRESDAVFAVDYRGISVPQAADLRTKLRDADATFRVTKNTLTERAADQAGAEALKELLAGPTALTFVRGDVAAAAKAIADYQRTGDLLPFKGGLLDGTPVNAEQLAAISRLPSREVLYGQLVGLVASPLTGVARGLNALIAGVAIALSQVNEKKQSGELPAGEAPAAPAPAAEAQTPPEPDPEAAPATDTDTTDQDAEPPEPATTTEDPAEGPATTDATPQEN